MQAYTGKVEFPTLHKQYGRNFRFFTAESMRSAVNKMVRESFKDLKIKTRKPRVIVVTVRWVEMMEDC